MAGRTATETIMGYIYQFDYSIKQLLELPHNEDFIIIENIEDVDVHSCTEEIAIQCKYYAKTEYNHSVIAKPIRLMLEHYVNVINGSKPRIKYKLYGFYNSGHDKLTQPISIDFLKKHFFTYSKDKVEYKHHEKLGLSDENLTDFLSLLSIDIHAKEDCLQFKNIIDALKTQFNCDDFEAEHYFYNNALRLISHIAKNNDENQRKITKREFISKINRKEFLFHQWFLQLRSEKDYCKSLRNKHFSYMNIPSYERFFLIELEANFSKSELKDLLLTISRKWTKISQRETNPFCPYVYLQNIDENDLTELKSELHNDNFKFIDGYNFKGSVFCKKTMIQPANYMNKITLKLLDTTDNLNLVLSEVGKTKEIYQFYLLEPFFEVGNTHVKHIKIQYQKINVIKEII